MPPEAVNGVGCPDKMVTSLPASAAGSGKMLTGMEGETGEIGRDETETENTKGESATSESFWGKFRGKFLRVHG